MCSDEWRDIDMFAAQGVERGREGTTARPLDANLVDDERGEVERTFTCDGAFEQDCASWPDQ